MDETWHIWVSGRVQGVFYRASAQREAQRLGVAGYARNVPDGRVEIVAQGPAAALQQFVAWCQQGPAHANVSEVRVEPLTGSDSFDAFMVR